MNRILRLSLFAILITKCIVYGDDVGLEYDPKDGEAWEVDYGYYPFKSYQTIDSISPAFRKLVDSPQCHDDDYIFFTPRGHSIQVPGPMIVDNDGELIWTIATDGQAYNLVAHDIDGQGFLTYWTGNDAVRGHGQGDWYMLDSSYQQVGKISAVGKELNADLHELVITPEGTALIVLYQVYGYDLSDYKEFGEDEEDPNYIWDCLFQEIDMKTNKLLFTWRASDHHALNETYRDIGGGDGTKESPWDWYHLNSIQKDELGNYIISARYTHAITYINGTSGDVIWTLGGKQNDFLDLSDGLATKFANQHHARVSPLSTFPNLLSDSIRQTGLQHGEKTNNGKTSILISMFDNSAEDGRYTDTISHGLLVELNYPSVAPSSQAAPESSPSGFSERGESSSLAYTARLVHSYDHPQNVISSSQGSFQVLPAHDKPESDPKVLVGYGYNALWTEYSADGTVLCDVHFGSNYSWERGDVQSYRVLKFPWVGRPKDPPTAVLGDDTVYVSWNGATEVVNWVLQQSEKRSPVSESMWRNITTVKKSGFETEIAFDETDAVRYLRVVALDKDGALLGVSGLIDMGWEIGIFSTFPEVMNGARTGPLKMFLMFMASVGVLIALYEGCRKLRACRRRTLWRGFRGVGMGSAYA